MDREGTAVSAPVVFYNTSKNRLRREENPKKDEKIGKTFVLREENGRLYLFDFGDDVPGALYPHEELASPIRFFASRRNIEDFEIWLRDRGDLWSVLMLHWKFPEYYPSARLRALWEYVWAN